MADLLHEIAQKQLESLGTSPGLVIVHPNYARQHLLLGQVLQREATAYMRFEGVQIGQQDLSDQLNSALTQQGLKLEDVRCLVLDECDRAESSALDALLETVVLGQPRQVIVFSRSLPACVHTNSSIRSKCRLVPVERAVMLPDYAERDMRADLLEVRALGAGRVMLNGRSIDNWDGTLPRALFFYLVDRGMTTRSQIFETFWPNLSVREATNVFHVTKRKISEVLGTDLTVYWAGFYHIASHIELNYDTALFTELLQDSAVAEPDEAARLLTHALSIYEGSFLSETDMDWVIRRRQEMTQVYGEALIALAKIKEQQGHTSEALGLYLRASTTNPQREDIARSIMQIYRAQGHHRDAIYIYERLENELERSLGVSPARSLQELAAAIEEEGRQRQHA
jgi:DNA-binding SARP family transcriptional activator